MEQLLKPIAKLLKRASPRLYYPLIRLYFSENVSFLRALPHLPSENRLIAANYPYFAINMDRRVGLGGLMSWTVGVLAYCHEHNMIPRLLFTNPLYAPVPGEDWLEDFFVRQGALVDDEAHQTLPRHHYVPASIHLLRRMRGAYRRLTLQRAHDIFFGSLNFREELITDADAFCRAKGIGKNTIGVHFRGTDKQSEATRASWGDMAKAIANAIEPTKTNIFVASDEPEFIEFMKSQFKPYKVLDLGCREIHSGKPAHLAAGNRKVKGSEAIQTLIVLSRCGLLIPDAISAICVGEDL